MWSALLILGCRPPPVSPPPPPPPPPTADLTIVASPDDATIAFADQPPVNGSLSLDGLSPGTYALTITRRGFAPLNRSLTVEAGEAELRFALRPMPQVLSFTPIPETAAWRLTTSDGQQRAGQGAYTGPLPAGLTAVVLSQPGFNDELWTLFLDEDTDRTLWLDREGQVVDKVLEFKSGHHPKGVRFSPDGTELWASFLGGPPSVAGYDATTGAERHTLTLGKHGAVEVVYSHDGQKVYASQMETATVYEIDRAEGALLRTLPTGATWSKVMALSPEGDRLYVSNWVSADITEFDLTSGEVLRELKTVDTPRGMWMDPAGESLYVVGFGDGRLQKVDVETGARTELFTSAGGALRHIVGDVSRNRAYISDMRRARIWLLDLETGAVTALARTDANPNTIDLTPDGRLLFVSCRGQNNRESYYKPGPQWGSVLVFDALTGEKLDAIVAGNQPTALDVSDDGRFLAYSDMLDDRISVYAIPDISIFLEAEGGRAAVYRGELWKGRR
ncbi:MAG: beta-propeller fold lactonase family protein [Myxococcota bacterium]